MGYALAAIRENEDAAEASGVNALATKLSAMALSSVPHRAGRDLLRAVLRLHRSEPHLRARHLHRGAPARHRGRARAPWLGPLLGSFVLTPISEITRAMLRGRAGADIMLYGLILILVISFLPNGLMGWLRSRAPRRGARRERGARDPRAQQALRRPAGRQSVRSDGGARRDRRPHRAQRGGQDHRVPPDRGLPRAERRAPSASTGASLVGLKPHAICRRGPGADVPARAALRRPHRRSRT